MSKTSKIVLGVIGGFVALIVLIIVVAFMATAGPVKSAESYLGLLRSGNVEAAYKSTAKDFQATVSMSDFQRFLEAYPAFKNNQSASFSSREISNDTGTLKGELKATDGGVTPVEIKFVKENGEWRILGIQVKNTGIDVTQ